ncbi:hypothetical protein JKP88DRAFT_279638 [Tribonema minus]|uniref:2Fe-2S ferredoxin-type domain-containing protein n=1 Tax=Tribonema minus TaxID=303371 RepID=A0A836CC75_9STRA|nr:hypothetical protein JKP88DRAFT_279638 [Tribonema minus]
MAAKLGLQAGAPDAGTGMAKVSFRGKIVEVFNCRGLSACGTCAVHITKGKVYPETWNIHEQLRLRLPPFTCTANRDDLRLACQVEVVEDIEVLKCDGLWGQGTAPSREPAEDFKAYLGEGEFLLDMAQSGFRRPNPRVTLHKRAEGAAGDAADKRD